MKIAIYINFNNFLAYCFRDYHIKVSLDFSATYKVLLENSILNSNNQHR